MKTLRNHWYDIGGGLAISVLAYISFFNTSLTHYNLILWLNLVSLFLHQLEEYRLAATFPGMVNKVMYKSETPDRYPLNANTAVYVNVYFGWLTYILAAIMGQKAIWLGMATIFISLGNVIAHTILFNIKGKTIYNAGLITSWLCFAPCTYFFFRIVHSENLVSFSDYAIGIPLGIIFNVIGILKLIDWFADKNSPHTFKQRNLLPVDRNCNE